MNTILNIANEDEKSLGNKDFVYYVNSDEKDGHTSVTVHVPYNLNNIYGMYAFTKDVSKSKWDIHFKGGWKWNKCKSFSSDNIDEVAHILYDAIFVYSIEKEAKRCSYTITLDRDSKKRIKKFYKMYSENYIPFLKRILLFLKGEYTLDRLKSGL